MLRKAGSESWAGLLDLFVILSDDERRSTSTPMADCIEQTATVVQMRLELRDASVFPRIGRADKSKCG
jgi:hypothetical protein